MACNINNALPFRDGEDLVCDNLSSDTVKINGRKYSRLK